MKRKAPWPEAGPSPFPFLLCLVLLSAVSPCVAEEAGGLGPGGAGALSPVAGPATASLASTLEGGRNFENSILLTWKGVELRLRALAGLGEPGGLAFRAGLEGRRFMFGPSRAKGLLAFLSSPFSPRSSRYRLPLGLDPGLSSTTRGLCLAAGPASVFALIREEADRGESAGKEGSVGNGVTDRCAAGGLSLDLPCSDGVWSCLAALDWRSVEAPKAWFLDAPPALPGRAGLLAFSRERRSRSGSSAFSAGASFDRPGGIGMSMAMQTIVTINGFKAHASLVAVSPAYVGLSGSRPASSAALSLGAGLVLRPGSELSASFEAALARGETRSEASSPFLSRSLAPAFSLAQGGFDQAGPRPRRR